MPAGVASAVDLHRKAEIQSPLAQDRFDAAQDLFGEERFSDHGL
jgi:hypothetical protein